MYAVIEPLSSSVSIWCVINQKFVIVLLCTLSLIFDTREKYIVLSWQADNVVKKSHLSGAQYTVEISIQKADNIALTDFSYKETYEVLILSKL